MQVEDRDRGQAQYNDSELHWEKTRLFLDILNVLQLFNFQFHCDRKLLPIILSSEHSGENLTLSFNLWNMIVMNNIV